MQTTNDLICALDFERLAGTQGEERAREVILKFLDTLGIEHKIEAFGFMGFDRTRAVITARENTFEAFPFGLTDPGHITGELVFLENPEELAYSTARYQGKIILSCGSRPDIQALLKDNLAAGFISIGPPHTRAMAMTNKQHLYPAGVLPAVTVDHDTGLRLLEFVNRPLEIQIHQAVTPQKGANILARIPGTGPDRSLTLITAHYDSVARSPGSNDNAGGVIAVLKTLQYFARHRPERDLEAVFFSGEEWGCLGSFDYVNRHKEELTGRARLILNIDGAGDALGLNKYFVIGTPALAGYVDGVTKEMGMIFENNLDIFNSDCIPFSALGIPSVNIEKCLGKGSFFYHTPDDTATHTSTQGLDAPIRAAKGLLTRILNSGIYPVEKKIDPAMSRRVKDLAGQYTGHRHL